MELLTEHVLSALRTIKLEPWPTQELNPGVIHVLLSRGLAEVLQHQSPYRTHRYKRISHLHITEEGRNALSKQRRT